MRTSTVNPDWAKLPLFDRKGWKQMPFGAFADSINDRVEPSEAAEDIYVGLEHLDPQSLHIRRWGKGSDVIGTKLRFWKGDIIFGRRRAYQRKLAVAEFDGICSAHAMVVRAKPDMVLPEFLPFLMMSDRFMNRAVEISVGSLSPTINWKTLKLEEFFLPPLAQQRRIAEILWAVDEVETRLNKVSEDECAAHNTFQTNSIDAYLERGKTGEIPICRMSDILDEPICNGIFKKRENFGKGTLLINVTDIYGNFRLNPIEVDRVDANQKEITSFSALPGDVIFNRSSLVLAGIGHACLVPDWSEPMVFECHLMRARPNRNRVDNRYLCRYALSEPGRTYLMSRAQTTTMTTINQGDLGNMPVPLPPLEEQSDFADKLDNFDQIHSVIEEARESVNCLKLALLESSFGY